MNDFLAQKKSIDLKGTSPQEDKINLQTHVEEQKKIFFRRGF